MKLIVKTLGCATIAVLILAVSVFYMSPGTIVDLTNRHYANSSALEKKSVRSGDYDINYYEGQNGGNKPTLILLHGLADNKDSFLRSAMDLSDRFHVILPDLAGHGENQRRKDLDYSISGQVDFLERFVEQIGVDQFHLGGNSMGGHISVAYSLKHPGKMQSLILINAPGLKIDEHIVYTGFGEPLENRDQLRSILEKVFYQVPDLPGPISDFMIDAVNKDHDFVNNLLVPQIRNGEDFNLLGRISDVSVPTLILWGRHDQVVKFNVAERYHQDIPMSTLDVIEEASHSPQLEVPARVAAGIISFVQDS